MTGGFMYTPAPHKLSVVLLFSALILDYLSMITRPPVRSASPCLTVHAGATGCMQRTPDLRLPATTDHRCDVSMTTTLASVAMLNVFLESFVAAAQTK